MNIKVGSIVFSPEYGKGQVMDVINSRTKVWFQSHMGPKYMDPVSLLTTNPAEDLAAKDARIAALEAERDAYKAFYDLLMNAATEGPLLDFMRAKHWMHEAPGLMQDTILPTIRALRKVRP